jgi:hypothetical protein
MTGRTDGHDAPQTHDSVEVSRDGQVVAAADISTTSAPADPAKVALSARRDVAPPGARGELVDQVLDHPDVAASDSVHVVVPLGDTESISRLQERTTNVTARAAGASSVIEADVVHPAAKD